MSMSIHYVCRFCGHNMGEIKNRFITEQHLGFDTLTAEEKKTVLSYKENGDIQANVICEHCQETIDRSPELLLQPNILQ